VEEGLGEGGERERGITIPTILRLSFQMMKTKTITMMTMKWQISSAMMKIKRLFRRMKD
jgi:hypothetical protein